MAGVYSAAFRCLARKLPTRAFKEETMQIKQLFTCLTLAMTSAISHAAVLYDVSFASPPNINGQSIVIDGTPHTPSRVNMGIVEMQTGYAGQPGNWAVFHAPTCRPYDQIEFKLPAGLSKAYLRFDVIPDGLNNSQSGFAVLLDSSDYSARSLNWHGGTNTMYLSNISGGGSFGAFVNLQKYQVQLHVDVPRNLLEVEINGNKVYSGVFGSTDLQDIRMSLSPVYGNATNCDQARAAVSNVLVYEDPSDIQTPPPAPLLGVSLSLRAGYPNLLPASGGYIRHTRSLSNLSPVDKLISYWITTSLPDGSGYPLLTPRTVTVAPGSNLTELKSFGVPAWFPAGGYVARLVAVDPTTGERVYGEIPFSKSAN